MKRTISRKGAKTQKLFMNNGIQPLVFVKLPPFILEGGSIFIGLNKIIIIL